MRNDVSRRYLILIKLLMVMCTQTDACVGYSWGLWIDREVAFSNISIEYFDVTSLEASIVLQS